MVINRFRSRSAVVILLFFFISLNLMACSSTIEKRTDRQAKSESIAQDLIQGKSIIRELSGGMSHKYQIKLGVKQFLRVVVEQQGIDVVVSINSPDGDQIVEVDSFNGTQGFQPLLIVTKAAGNYQLTVSSLEKEAIAGRYKIEIAELRDAIAADDNQILAQQYFADGWWLSGQASAEQKHQAVEKLNTALTLFRSLNDRRSEAEALQTLGYIYELLGERQKALDYYRQALPIRRIAEDRAGEAVTLGSIGTMFGIVGNKQDALNYLNQALNLYRMLNDRLGEAISLNNIGYVEDMFDNRWKGLEYYLQVLPIKRMLHDRRGEVITLANIGTSYDAMGEKQLALEYFFQAFSHYHELNDPSGQAKLLNNLGNVYRDLGEPQKALDYFNQALEIQQRLGNRAEEAVILGNISRIHHDRKDYQQAIDYLNRTIAIHREIGDRRGEGLALSNIGKVYNDLGEKERALNYFNQSLPIRQALGDRFGEAYTLAYIGNTYSDLGKRAQALKYYHQGLQLARACLDPLCEIGILHGIARLERARGNINNARKQIEDALTIIESLRGKVDSGALRSSFFAFMQKYYEFYIDLLMENPTPTNIARALQASERARARSLLESLTEAQADIRQGVDPKLIEQERDLQRLLNGKIQANLQLASNKSTPLQLELARREIEALHEQLQQLETEIRKNSPHYAELKYPKTVDLTEIQQQILDDNTVLLEYTLGEERSYLWAVTANSISSYRLPKRDTIEAAAHHIYDLINARSQQQNFETADDKARRIAQADIEFANAAPALSEMLLQPVMAQLSKKRLLIVGDGALHYLPFAALPMPVQMPAQNSVPLLVEHEIVNLPSASTLVLLRQELAGRTPANKTIAVLADPVFDNNDERVTQAKVDSKTVSPTELAAEISRDKLVRSAFDLNLNRAGIGFSRLLSTRQEAEAIKDLVTASERRIALDFDANLKTVGELSQYRIIHFATHGFINSNHPDLSGLVLSLVNREGEAQIGFLPANEIFNLNLPAELIVLSACSTGLGKQIRGEGLVGLTQGFMYAGAARIIVSLWNINDKATAELMTRFYKKMLGEKRPPTQALREAQLEIAKQSQWQAPYYWSGFILQGEYR